MKRELFRGRLLFIYQMPKTGSQTVEATLQQCQLPHQVLRFHFLSPEFAQSMKNAMQTRQPTEAWKETAFKQLRFSRTILQIIRWRKWLCLWPIKAPKLDVIASVREPIGLGLSSIFQNHALLFPGLASATPESCRTELLRPKALKDIQNWFDIEIKAMLGIDVYATPFPKQSGYAIYESHFVRLLVYRYEALEQLPRILAEFFDCEVPRVINRNIGRTKAYGSAYEEVKKELRLPIDFVMKQCNSKMMCHFYSDSERRKLIERWAEQSPFNKAVLAA